MWYHSLNAILGLRIKREQAASMGARRVAISVDVWNTLLSTAKFFDALSRGLSVVIGISASEALESVNRAYKRVKEMRARGELDLGRIVDQCIEVLAEELKASREDVRRGVARTVAFENLDHLAFEDAAHALKEMRDLEIPVVALSNVTFWPGWYTRLILERSGLGELLTAQVYADEAHALKPDPRMFLRAQKALEEAGVKAEVVAHVGDDFREDFLGAMIAGLKGVLVDRQGRYEEGSYFHGRGCVVRSMSRLAELLELK